MDELIEWINKYTELYPIEKEAEFTHKWKPTDRQELYTYFSMLIHMGITIESSIKDYWGNLELASAGHVVKNYIGLMRF